MKIFTLLFLSVNLSGWADCSDSLWSPQRECDTNGRLLKERFLNGKSIEISYDEFNRVIEILLEGSGSITYKYDDTKLFEVSRISPSGQKMYTHSYEYDRFGGLLDENLIFNLGRISYDKDLSGKFIRIESPYSEEICKFNSKGVITSHSLNGKTFEYSYDNDNQLISFEIQEQKPFVEYDQNGNLTTKISAKGRHYLKFDQRGNLVEAITDECKINYFYDDLDRRVAKKTERKGKEETETYLYFGNNEIAIYSEDGTLKQLRIPGLSTEDNFILPVAIETEDEIYAPIHDYRGNLSKLISTRTGQVIPIPAIDPFGQNLNKFSSPTPWIFSSKHYDAETHLVYFGSRYYDPELKQWITPDPLGTLQHPNVYLYCLGNPVSYFDPDGKFAFAVSLLNFAWGAGAVLTFPAWGTAAVVTAAGAAVGWATYEVIQKVKDGKQRDGTPGWNGPQNDQFKDAKKEIEKKIGRKLSQDEENKLHRHISGQNYGYHEIVEEGFWLFNGN